MHTSGKSTGRIDTRVLLSTLWIVVVINMLKADILSLFIPGATDELADAPASTDTTRSLKLMLGGAIMMEISICMILPSHRAEV